MKDGLGMRARGFGARALSLLCSGTVPATCCLSPSTETQGVFVWVIATGSSKGCGPGVDPGRDRAGGRAGRRRLLRPV